MTPIGCDADCDGAFPSTVACCNGAIIAVTSHFKGDFDLSASPPGGWHESRITANVLIAIPVLQEHISPVLDTAARLLLVTRQRGKEVARREFVLGPLPPEGLARSVAELRVDLLLCAALSEPLLRALERRGVRVKPHLCGEVESVLRAFDRGQLQRDEFRMPGCWGQHSHGVCCLSRRVARHGKSSGKET